MKQIKKGIAFLITITMLLGLMPTVAFAQQGEPKMTKMATPPTLDGTTRVYANGTPVVIMDDGGVTKIYDANNLTTALFSDLDIGNYIIYGGWADGDHVGNTSVTMKSGTVTRPIYGGSREGTITGTTNLIVNGGNSNTIYGGSALLDASVTNTILTINGGTVDFVFGGGLEGPVLNNTNVTIKDAQINGCVYGGGDLLAGEVLGTATINMSGATTIGGFVAGGGIYAPVSNTNVMVDGTTIISGHVYGGGIYDTAIVTGNTSVSIKGNTLLSSIFGGGSEADVNGDTSILVEGTGTLNCIQGGGQLDGNVGGSSYITIKGGTVLDTIWGGGNANYQDMTTAGDVIISIEGGTVNNVYGGGYGAVYRYDVRGSAIMNIFSGANVQGTVVTEQGTPVSMTSVGVGSKVVRNLQVITYDSNGGSTVATDIVEVGNLITKPADPTRAGYTFDGWYNGTNKWDFSSDSVTSNITLQAHWIANSTGGGGGGGVTTYTVTFDSKGGSTVSNYTGVISGSTIKTPTAPTKSGYDFAGWYKDDTTFVTPWDFTADKVTSNITLYAKWTSSSSSILNGWVKVGNDYYYYKDGVKVTSSWITTKAGNKYYVGANGKMVKSKWITTKYGNKYYVQANGRMARSKWITTKAGNKYYVQANGRMARSKWITTKNGNQYYVDKNGRMTKKK